MTHRGQTKVHRDRAVRSWSPAVRAGGGAHPWPRGRRCLVPTAVASCHKHTSTGNTWGLSLTFLIEKRNEILALPQLPQIFFLNNAGTTTQKSKFPLEQGETTILQSHGGKRPSRVGGTARCGHGSPCFSRPGCSPGFQRLAASHVGSNLVNPARWPFLQGSTCRI